MRLESSRIRIRYWGAVVLLAALYFVTGKLGLKFAFINPSATAVWPPTGISLVAFMLLGNRIWPGIMLGAFLVNITTAGSIATTIGIAIGNTLEGLAGAYLVNKFANGLNAFDRPKDLLNFIIVAPILSTAVSATIGVTSLCLGAFAEWHNFGSIWLTWWLGDAVGDLVVAPLLLLWSVSRTWRWTLLRSLEGLSLITFLILVGMGIFSNWLPFGPGHYPLEFASIPVIIWAAFRFDLREIAAGVFILSGFAIWGTLHDYGPFTRASQHESLLLVQMFIGFMSVMALSAGVVVSERKKIIQELQYTLAQVKTLTGMLPICAWCKKIRNDDGYWQEVESYIHEHSNADFSHGACPDCVIKYKTTYVNKRRRT